MNALAVLALSLLMLTLFCRREVLSINYSGSGVDGDPPPGRSPGPPPVSTGNDRRRPKVDVMEDKCGYQSDTETIENDLLNLTVSHELFTSDLLVAGVVYEVRITRNTPGPIVDFAISSSMSAEFVHHKMKNCNPFGFKGQLESQTLLNWTIGNYDDNISNITLRLNYVIGEDPTVYEQIYSFPTTRDCKLFLKPDSAAVTQKNIPGFQECRVWFPSTKKGHGLVVELIRLNVPCGRGFVHFYEVNETHHQSRAHNKPTKLCGKLEELAEAERHIHFPSIFRSQPFMHLHGKPTFSVSYRLVDYCYNVTFVSRNGSFELRPTGELQCTFKIYLPYGNRIALKLQIGDSSTRESPDTVLNFQDLKNGLIECDGLLTQLQDGTSTWSHCTKPGDAERQIEIVSKENKISLKVFVRNIGSNSGALGLRMSYRADAVEEIVGPCDFGWIAVNQFCVATPEQVRLTWTDAEGECVRRGGHLLSIRSERDQNMVDRLLFNSPGYKEHNAYWIGASDKAHESDFRWSDGLPFAYTNWFPGWPQHQHYNKQPNDDGLSEQDCVEARRTYSVPSSSIGFTPSFMWNDRDCSALNYFLCERLQSEDTLATIWPTDCNHSVTLSNQQPRTAISSPGFPRHYPDNYDCDTNILAPSGYRIILDFEELVIENEPSCSYDYLEISENSSNASSNQPKIRRLCGDWSTKLKLLRYVSQGSRVRLRFSSDYSHHYGGYKARVSMENAMQCGDDRFHLFKTACYLVVSYPEVTWTTAQQICRGLKANLTSVLTSEEGRFITSNIRRSPEYRTSAVYWLGGKAEPTSDFKWIDGNPMDYSGWLPGQRPTENDLTENSAEPQCLAVKWTPSLTPMMTSGLYWKSHKCTQVGGYICKRKHMLSDVEVNFNKTVNSSEGTLTTPNHPENYFNNLDFLVRIVGPERTRLVIRFDKIDIESQLECLYDYVELKSSSKFKEPNDAVKYCGSHERQMRRFDFVSATNEAEVRFHSDYSVTGNGFSLSWHAVDVSACPFQTLTTLEGTISSPNYPDFLLAHLDCTFVIRSTPGKRVWIEFSDIDLDSDTESETPNNENKETIFELQLSKRSEAFRPFEMEDLLTDGSFISVEETLKIRLRTGAFPKGRGFQAFYKTISNNATEEKIIPLRNSSAGVLLHLNYPGYPPPNINFLQRLVAPLGYTISLELHRVKLSEADCKDRNGVIEVYDSYSDTNGTLWKLCYDTEDEMSLISPPAIYLKSFLNTLQLRQKSGVLGNPLNGSLKVFQDEAYKKKIINADYNRVESCMPNPCQYGGRCVNRKSRKICQCVGHFTGLFCALTQCELEPCVFGTCQLTNSSYKCHCKAGYIGPTCEQKRKPCEGNPCESRGTCIEKGGGFQCQCHAWWEGSRCEKRMLHIPYKPLSERMLHEPFWLGLMTVFVVMGVIGLVWCAKRHFPEKIEKLLAEDDNRNRIHSLRSTSVREQLAAASSASAVTVTPSPGPGSASRSIFGRLGTPSPKKKRNNSTPTKKNVAEKKQILQQLISPVNKQTNRKVNLVELIQMSESKGTQNGPGAKVKETKFSENDAALTALNDPKLEKKVTFARLLNKVSAEMSSGSDMEMGIMQANRLGFTFARPSSTPPSPGVNTRSPNSTSSNQGSDSFTSSDLAIPTALSSSISDLLINRRQNSKSSMGRQKPASADSILAMFRNFSTSSAGANLPSSLKLTPSTTPTASSPHDDVVGDDESSSSSVHTPISFSSGPPESPILHHPGYSQSTIEVPVLDPLSAHRTSGNNLLHPPTILLEIPSTINKCLSPIRELPTPLPSPMPSPALTPVMRRSPSPMSKRGTTSSSLDDPEADDKISIEIPNISISNSDEDDHYTDIAIDPQAEDGLILEEAAVMKHGALYKTKIRPPPLGQLSDPHTQSITPPPPPPLVIPTLIIETPSPTRKSPSLLFPGSPPPQRAFSTHEPAFQFPSKGNRKFFKDFDKPTSLDLPNAPPLITITCNMSEVDSDAESTSVKPSTHHHGVPQGGMTYLSPFSMGPRGEQHASESNLSSSGYSSMASPGPSRCGSNNPLCPSEMEDQGPPGSGSCLRRQSLTPVLKTSSNTTRADLKQSTGEQRRGRSDSETLSDDPLIESNDEGIGTDHIDEKIDEGEVKSAKELEVFMTDAETKGVLDLPLMSALNMPRVAKCVTIEDPMDRLLPPVVSSKNSLQLPSIVVQLETHERCEKMLSPMSSRSESPLSDRTTRFSPLFYGRNKDLLPFTDSDGLYDFPSSDKVNVSNPVQHKKVARKREKRTPRSCKTPSPTKPNPAWHNHLDVPSKDFQYKVPPPRKLSPKRRLVRTQIVSSSSSSDSITSTKEFRRSSSSPSPDTIRWSSPVGWLDQRGHKSLDISVEEKDFSTCSSPMLSKSLDLVKCPPKQPKISRLRAISNQIRFLKRLEQSLKRRTLVSPSSDTFDSEDESPMVTSPLLQPSKRSKIEIKKSSSISRLQGSGGVSSGPGKTRYRKWDSLLTEEKQPWTKEVISKSGRQSE
ncbi:uncharacterized protein LOC132698003 isoform X2 [Cylas formicarius]|uniref:uncharacterized protein LOC132698003 isoform X2 n=1 Tax=Cylas formicarius TaxID=197179 RepID=UPI002958432A|nr:uncharacterized protein LOC132698003 isoform X2 [Cylas formicarius]